MDYIYPNDGKIHLRYSDLKRCTPGQVDRLIAEHRNPELRFESEHMKFGTDRHEMWRDESRETGLIPKCFAEIENGKYMFEVSHVEEEFVTEIAAGIVIHSRPDAVCEAHRAIVDVKTVLDGENGFEANVAQYKRSEQAPFYAFQVAIHGIRIERVIYLCEIWSQDRTKIIGYRAVERQISLLDIAKQRNMAIERASLYKAAIARTPIIN